MCACAINKPLLSIQTVYLFDSDRIIIGSDKLTCDTRLFDLPGARYIYVLKRAILVTDRGGKTYKYTILLEHFQVHADRYKGKDVAIRLRSSEPLHRQYNGVLILKNDRLRDRWLKLLTKVKDTVCPQHHGGGHHWVLTTIDQKVSAFCLPSINSSANQAMGIRQWASW